jgi:PAS domain S-box-containing protein
VPRVSGGRPKGFASGVFTASKPGLYRFFLNCAIAAGFLGMTGLELFVALLVGAAVGALVMLREKMRADTRLRNAISALPAGIAFFDRKDRLYLWNDAWSAASGNAASLLRRGVQFRELLRAQLQDGHYAEAAGRETQWIDERLATRAVGAGAREQDLGNGRWHRVQDRRTADGGTVSICADVTDARRGEASFKLMFDNNPVPMWLWEGSSQLRLLDLNQAALDHLGYTRDAIAGLTVFDLLSDEERPALNAMIASGIVRPYDGERMWRPRRVDGTLRFAMPYIHILPTQGTPHFVGAIVDVTERVAAEQELRHNAQALSAALDKAEGASRAKSEFLAAMSHELRTPLNAILGFSDILQKQLFGPVGNQRYLDYAQNIHGSGEHLLGLINDILDLARLDAGQLQLSLEPVDIIEVVESCELAVALQADKGQLRLTHSVEPVTLRADTRRLRQMLLNLLSNAIKFTPEGGEVAIDTARSSEGFAISVRDTGIGMAREDVPKAMERFGQIDASLSRKYEGTGLGLPLTQRLAELHGANFAIQSEPGHGTRVTITFPPSALIVPPRAMAS